MGSGRYSTVASVNEDGQRGFARADSDRTAFYSGSNRGEIFRSKNMDADMDPRNVEIREARDSEEHPNSVPIVLGLDETGSMGRIPHYLIKEGLPNIMGRIIEGGILDPQLLVLGLGDHFTDESPLQVGQFESSDELLDKWLEKVYLEGNGGGNGGESYHLAWYFASKYTVTDSLEKRDKKGLLFTVGDEPVHDAVTAKYLKGIMGQDMEAEDYTAKELLEMAKEKFHVFHIHITTTASGGRASVVDKLRNLLGESLILVSEKEQIARVICDKILSFIPYYLNQDGEEEIIDI